MGWERFSSDELEQRLLARRALQSRLDAEMVEILEVLDRRQVANR
jgi:hypothetical protein